MEKKGILAALMMLAFFGCRTIPAALPPQAYNDILLSCADERAVLPGANILSVSSEEDKFLRGRWLVRIELNSEAAKEFGDITRRNVGKKLTLSVGGTTILTATIMEPIYGGEITITSYSRDEAAKLLAMFRKTRD
jgi:preprotein translocase subunit SecD